MHSITNRRATLAAALGAPACRGEDGGGTSGAANGAKVVLRRAALLGAVVLDASTRSRPEGERAA